MELTRKRIILIAAGIVVLAAVIYGFWPDPISVQTQTAERGPMQVMIEEEGHTTVTERYVISSPVTAMMRRMNVRAGDQVDEGEAIAEFEAPPSALLDRRSEAEAVARVEGAEAAVRRAERQVEAAEALQERAQEERRRVERLYEQESVTRQELETARAEELQATANLESARAAVAQAEADLMSARAATARGAGVGTGQAVQRVLRAPAAGRVLTIHRESEGLVSPGEVLVEIGDTDMLEVHVDVLSQDALRIEPGTPVRLDQWGGDEVLRASVDRVEPQAHTDISALGVEEQRVAVIANLTSPAEQWQELGSGYRVLAQFVIWEDDDALRIPTSALFRTDEGWGVFVIENGRAARRSVDIGQQSGLSAQVISGVEEGEDVITHPGNNLEDGVRVQPRDT